MARLLLLLALLPCLLQSGAGERRDTAVKLVQKRKNGSVHFIVENKDAYGPHYLILDFESRQNLEPSRPLPLRAVLAPGERQELLSIRPKDKKLGWSYRVGLTEGFGDPEAKPDLQALYLLPFEHGTKHPLGQGYFGPSTHHRIRALDFDMPTGTKVCAAREGVVVALKQDSSRGGASPNYARDANYVDVLHADGTWASYAHLRHRGVLVRHGQRVKAGEVLGLSGATGQAQGPHLHFSVQKAAWSGDPETIPTRLRIDALQSVFPVEGKYYYAWHPGKPAFRRESADMIDEDALRSQDRPASGGEPRIREHKVEDKMLIYAVNPNPSRLRMRLEFSSRDKAASSRPLPLEEVIPPRTERFLFSVRMQPGGSYGLTTSMQELP